MADLTITATSVVKGAGAVTQTGIAGVAVTAGQALYKDPTDSNKLKLADCDSATAAVRVVAGVALHGAAANQPVTYQTGGVINLGATLTAGTVYCLSDVAGGIRPVADNGSGDGVSLIGVAISTSLLSMNIFNSGAQV